jgi:hypothetical protein
MRADLRQEALGNALCRVSEEDGAKLQSAPNCLLHHAQTLYRAVASVGALPVRKSLTDLLYQGMVTSFDSAKPVLLTGFEIGTSSHRLS